MNLAAAEKEIRALARRLGVRAHQVRAALETMDASDCAGDIGTPAAVMAGSTGDHHEPDRNQEARSHARQKATRQGRQARLLTANDLAARPPIVKDQPVRHQGYLRLVAARPCKNCGVIGASQAAHENSGKGLGTKTGDTRTMPLCHVGANNCHALFDQYKLFPTRAQHVAAGAKWARETAHEILAEGDWPKNLEFPYPT